jgi:hypothetical protein
MALDSGLLDGLRSGGGMGLVLLLFWMLEDGEGGKIGSGTGSSSAVVEDNAASSATFSSSCWWT